MALPAFESSATIFGSACADVPSPPMIAKTCSVAVRYSRHGRSTSLASLYLICIALNPPGGCLSKSAASGFPILRMPPKCTDGKP